MRGLGCLEPLFVYLSATGSLEAVVLVWLLEVTRAGGPRKKKRYPRSGV